MILVLDTETSGKDPKIDHLIEVGAARVDIACGKMIDCRSWLIESRSNEAEHINGIPASILEPYGMPDGDLGAIRNYVNNGRCVIAHNASFDQQWLPMIDAPWVCSQHDIEWPRREAMGTGSLEKLALAHGVGVLPGHRAMHDVLTIVRVLEVVHASIGAPAFKVMIDRAMRPKGIYQAIVSFQAKDSAKDAGFNWEPDWAPENVRKKAWLKRVAVEDADSLMASCGQEYERRIREEPGVKLWPFEARRVDRH